MSIHLSVSLPVGKSGGNPELPAISQCAYGKGCSEPRPC